MGLALRLHPSAHHTTCPSSFSSSVSASTELFVTSNGVYLSGAGWFNTYQRVGAEAALRVSFLHQNVAVRRPSWTGWQQNSSL